MHIRLRCLASRTSGCKWLPAKLLLLTDAWIKANAPSLLEVRAEAAATSPNGKHATRVVHARLTGRGEAGGEIEYDLLLAEHETHQKRHDKHRRREEACIRRLDGTAAAAHRAKKAAEQQQRRADEAEVRSVLDYTIFRLERRHEYETITKPMEAAAGLLPQACWSCGAGCESGACARAAFRQQCVPSSSDITSFLQKR